MKEYKVAENISKKELLYMVEYIVNNYLFAKNEIKIEKKNNKHTVYLKLSHEQYYKFCHDYEQYRNSFL